MSYDPVRGEQGQVRPKRKAHPEVRLADSVQPVWLVLGDLPESFFVGPYGANRATSEKPSAPISGTFSGRPRRLRVAHSQPTTLKSQCCSTVGYPSPETCPCARSD